MSKRENFINNNPDLYKTFELIYKKLMLIEEYESCLRELDKSFKNKSVKPEFRILSNVIANSIRQINLLEICKLIDSGQITFSGLFSQIRKIGNGKYNLKIKEHEDLLSRKNNKISKLFSIRIEVIAHSTCKKSNIGKTFHLSDNLNDRNVDDIVKLIFEIYEYWSRELMDTLSGSWNEKDKKMYITEPCVELAKLFCEPI